MIIKRIIGAFRRQDWFSVAIETLIVVLGVFLGLQVNNWNDARQARADERIFLLRLHDDVVEAEAISARLRERRFHQRDAIVEGMSVLFGRSERRDLTEEECLFIAFSHDYTLTASELPSFDELLSSGRLGIIRDRQLVNDLASFRQALEVLAYWRSWGTRDQHTLPDKYPELFQVESYYDETMGEVWSRSRCNTDAMRRSQRFLNNLSENADTFDGFVRDALDPWNKRLTAVHARLDEILGLDHETER
ncbi:MAG: hypothetical protein R3C31_14080 [Hyphomonadaceae bacterium]